MLKFLVIFLLPYPYVILLLPFWSSVSGHFVEESSLFAHCHHFHVFRMTRSFIIFLLFPSSENILCYSETSYVDIESNPHMSRNNLQVMVMFSVGFCKELDNTSFDLYVNLIPHDQRKHVSTRSRTCSDMLEYTSRGRF
jgi:hypothetical protein